MKLSIIIVNYNVEFFLEQCLLSVKKACKNIESEIWVVDNNSVDYSVQMLRNKFPDIKLILNKENLGFSKANNQAIKQAKGKYILLLNPDTIVEEDTFEKIISYMDDNQYVGGLGVKMLDGKGNFLAESKRGLPTPWVAFYKISGLSKLFPKSKRFGRYHLGFLNKDKIHEVDILAGAFMLIPSKVFKEIGLLDERFFMYGEDIDLSFRIQKAGYKNIYFPLTSIIHFKGESTKKSSINYVFIFYKAMVLFAQKHFSSGNAKIFGILINLAIYTRAFAAIAFRFLKTIYLPLIDFLVLIFGVYVIHDYWEETYLFDSAYPWYYAAYVLPVYSFIWIISSWLSGAYDIPFFIGKSSKGIGYGTLFILLVYALLPDWLRFSRAIILFGTLYGFLSLGSIRLVFTLLKFSDFSLYKPSDRRYAIIGNLNECRRVAGLIRNLTNPPGFIGLISLSPISGFEEGLIGEVDKAESLITIYGINELVFCTDDIEASRIIQLMSQLNNSNVSYKIAPKEANAIIGSQSITQAGNLYMIDIDGILKPNNRRSKRFFDIFCTFVLLLISPILILLLANKTQAYKNIFSVLFSRKSWVGYDLSAYNNTKLPKLKTGIFYPKDAFPEQNITVEMSGRLNLMYAQNYKLKNDLHILVKSIKKLGRKVN